MDRDVMFDDNYIPLDSFAQDGAPDAGPKAKGLPRTYRILPRLEHLLSNPGRYIPNSVREKTWPSSHIAATISTSGNEMGVQSSNVGSEGRLVPSTITLSSTSKHVQTANLAGHPGGDGYQLIDLTIPKPLGPLMPSAHAGESAVSSPKTLSTLTPSHTKGVDIPVYNVSSSSARKPVSPLFTQSPNEPALRSANPVQGLLQPKLAVSDPARANHIESKGNS